MGNIKDLQTSLGIHFKDTSLLEIALTHRSYINESQHKHLEHNERLEFLGDAVLELIVTEHLYRNYDDPEGTLTNWRSALVRSESLSDVGEKLGINAYLRLSRGEAHGSPRARKQILANAMEALIGAIHLDQGYKIAEKFVLTHIVSNLPEIIRTGAWQDAKTKYQELIQDQEGVTPTYKVIESTGPDHDKRFTVGAYVDGELRGKGAGTSKQAAQQSAAEQALRDMGETA